MVTGYKRKEIKFGIRKCGNNKINGHWLQKKRNQIRDQKTVAIKYLRNQNWDQHQHGITAIPTSVAAFSFTSTRHLRFVLLSQPHPLVGGAGCAVVLHSPMPVPVFTAQCLCLSLILAATDVGIAVMPC